MAAEAGLGLSLGRQYPCHASVLLCATALHPRSDGSHRSPLVPVLRAAGLKEK